MDVFQALEMPVYGIAQGACPFSVHHPDAWQMGQVGVVQVFVQKRQGLVQRTTISPSAAASH